MLELSWEESENQHGTPINNSEIETEIQLDDDNEQDFRKKILEAFQTSKNFLWAKLMQVFVDHSIIATIIFAILPLLALLSLLSPITTDVSLTSFRIRNHPAVKHDVAALAAREQASAMIEKVRTQVKRSGHKGIEIDSQIQKREVSVAKQTINSYKLHIVFELKSDSKSDTIFTKPIISFIREVEKHIISRSDNIKHSSKKWDSCRVCGGTNKCIKIPESLATQSVDLYWGIIGVDETSYDANDPFATYKGLPLYDTSFTLSDPGVHQYLVSVCASIKNRTDLVLDTQVHRCVIESFDTWLKMNSIKVPTGQEYVKEMINFLITYDYWEFLYDVGFQQNVDSTYRISWVRFSFKSRMGHDISSFEGLQVYNNWEAFIADILSHAPPSMGSSVFTVSSVWERIITEVSMVRGITFSLCMSSGIAFLSLVVFIGNFIVPLWATFSIICCIAVLLGFFWLLGWTLGALEAIAISIMVGLACDYVFHIADAYNEAKKVFTNPNTNAMEQRYQATQAAFRSMGVSIIGGAMTTILSSLVLLGTTITIFSQFGLIMTATIGLSVFYTLFFFSSILMLVGPRGHFGDSWDVCKKAVYFCWYRGKPPTSKEYPPNSYEYAHLDKTTQQQDQNGKPILGDVPLEPLEEDSEDIDTIT